jgi:hypothetical protein
MLHLGNKKAVEPLLADVRFDSTGIATFPGGRQGAFVKVAGEDLNMGPNVPALGLSNIRIARL